MESQKTIYGTIGRFKTTSDVYHAAEKVRDQGYQKWDVFTPFPIHGLNGAMGVKRSKVPIFTFLGGIVGFTTGMLITWYMNAYDYSLIVGGKPYWSPIFPFPVAYELTILLGAFGTLFGMFFTNRLPQHHHPAFEYDQFVKATDDEFIIVIENEDSQYEQTQVHKLLTELGATDIETIKV